MAHCLAALWVAHWEYKSAARKVRKTVTQLVTSMVDSMGQVTERHLVSMKVRQLVIPLGTSMAVL